MFYKLNQNCNKLLLNFLFWYSKKNKNLREMIGGFKIFENKNVLKATKKSANHVSRDRLIYVENNSKLA